MSDFKSVTTVDRLLTLGPEAASERNQRLPPPHPKVGGLSCHAFVAVPIAYRGARTKSALRRNSVVLCLQEMRN